MAKITVHDYEIFDEASGTTIRSKSPATRRAIDAAGGKIIEGTMKEVDIEMVSPDGVVVRWPQQPYDSPMSELKKTDVVQGSGAEAKAGPVSVHYTGWLHDPSKPDGRGKKFDSSVDRGSPFDFNLGDGQVIQGWDQGVAGMREGGKRTLVIPPSLGYGARGAGGVIPPNATLQFDIELVKVR
jgi:FKBP-type peptidyl-prolyl cis-trans isomerase FkpA